MKKKEKKYCTWLALLCIMVQDNFESKTITLLDHEYYAIARIKGMPSYEELEDAVDDKGFSHFDLVEWLLDGHIDDSATNRHEVEEIFAKTRHIVCDDVDEEGTWWAMDTTKGYRSDLYISQFKMNAADPSKPICTKKDCICKRG